MTEIAINIVFLQLILQSIIKLHQICSKSIYLGGGDDLYNHYQNQKTNDQLSNNQLATDFSHQTLCIFEQNLSLTIL